MSSADVAPRDIVIVGAGGHGREVLALLSDLDAAGVPWRVLGFVDDRPALAGTRVAGLPVMATVAEAAAWGGRRAFALGVGSPAAKRRLAAQLEAAGLVAPTLVHPTARVGPRVQLGRGAQVAAGTIITCDVDVGPFVTVNVACTLSHDVRVGAYATLAPRVNLTGNVDVGEGADVGVGVVTVQGRRIGPWSVLGAGAVVAADVPADCTAVGVPARAVKHRQPGWHLAE